MYKNRVVLGVLGMGVAAGLVLALAACSKKEEVAPTPPPAPAMTAPEGAASPMHDAAAPAPATN
ncbi:MAG: hypothetical protein OEW11_02210 [Nitrospirota bacterium]|nr:hypothetical protein [Nitrospirota bacterium]